MSDWIGLAVIAAIIVGGLYGVARLGTPRPEISEEEFERRVREGGHTRAGLFGLQQLLHPKAVKSIEVQQDLKHGYYNKKKVADADDSPKSQVSSRSEPET